MPLYDSDGNELQVRVVGGRGCAVNADGTVDCWAKDEHGNREEWTEPLCDSPIRDVFPDWVWGLMDEHLDPRNET